VLIFSVIVAILIANSPLASSYANGLSTPLFLHRDGQTLTVLDWINDGLMAMFFLGIGMEIKKELVTGTLLRSTVGILPINMAIGGMLVPATIYLIFTGGTLNQSGWAIHTATDIAFTLGILSLLGKRIPPTLRMTVISLAIIDDIGAVIIIALFYNSHLSLPFLLSVGAIAIIQYSLRNIPVARSLILILGIGLWYCMLQSGIHPTIAGIITGLLLPYSEQTNKIERRLSVLSSFLIVPIFSIANAGVPISAQHIGSIVSNSVVHGVVFGLIIGKPVGIILAAMITLNCIRATLPDTITMKMLSGASILCGIGFTMSLFITNLSFSSPDSIANARIAILSSAIISGSIGYIYLRKAAISFK